MKKTSALKCIIISSAALMVSGCVSTCASPQPTETEAAVIPETPKQEVQSVVEEPKPVAAVNTQKPEPPVQEVPKQEPEKPAPAETKKEEPRPTEQKVSFVTENKPREEQVPEAPKEEQKPEEPKVAEQPKAEEPKPSSQNEEYLRAVEQMEVQTVSEETFNEDKRAVMALIDDLNDVMKNKDYNAWLTYLDDESIRYWSQRSNLQQAQKRLPVRGIKINTMQDYFTYIFIPAREGRTMDEIRYLTDSSVKAVQVQKDENGKRLNDVVYYNLVKINGSWKLHLPSL